MGAPHASRVHVPCYWAALSYPLTLLVVSAISHAKHAVFLFLLCVCEGVYLSMSVDLESRS